MPTIIMTKFAGKLDPAIRAKTMTFLQKLAEDDTVPGLHVEPLVRAIDPRVRTGRVDQGYRAVMFRIDEAGERHYVIHGVWPHDEAIDIANRLKLKVNPVNGLPQFEQTPAGQAPAWGHHAPAPVVEPAAPPPAPVEPAQPVLVGLGITAADLIDRLGFPPEVASAAMEAADEDAILELAEIHDGSWLGLALIDLATGIPIEEIVQRLQGSEPVQPGDEDADLLESLRLPGAQANFAFVEGQEELRRVIEGGDFGAWRVFLHPDQRRYVEGSFSGPFRLSGGAGTGKTVVLVHRARRLACTHPDARIVMTTFTTNLAELLRESLVQLDPSVRLARRIGEPGVYVTGVDALASAVLASAGRGLAPAIESILGPGRAEIVGRTPSGRWRAVLDGIATTAGPDLANEAFLAAEYATVILPNRITSLEEYLKVRRPGRGVALDRGRRQAVWSLVEAYRAHNRIDGTVDFAEAAAIAAAHLGLTANPDRGAGDQPALADHVLIDEGQDLSPPHWQLLRNLVLPGPDDMFIAEDSHQRIYGPRTVLSRYGIGIVGRSRRLTLNYRTTAQNLHYALGLLEGGAYVDLEDAPEQARYRSARTGPNPAIVTTGSVTEDMDVTAAVVEGWLAQGTTPETIAVLVRDRYQRDRMVNGLAERGVMARAVDRDRVQPGKPVVMTMHRAKGTEFAKVALLGIGTRSPAELERLAAMDEAERMDVELRERSLLYVAASRARDELLVLQRP